MHLVERKDKYCFKTSMIYSIFTGKCAIRTSKAIQLLVDLGVYAGGLERFRIVTTWCDSLFFTSSYRISTWRALLKSVGRHSVSGATHKGGILCTYRRVSVHAIWVYDSHLEGTSEGIEPSLSKVCVPLSPKRMVLEVSVMSV